MKQLACLVNVDELIAVEIDATHIKIAQQWFEVDSTIVTMVHDDAIAWLKRYQGPPFDLIIDDLFGHASAEPERVQAFTDEWVACLSRHLVSSGLLVANFIKPGELNRAVPVLKQHQFMQGFRWSQLEYANTVGVFLKEPVLSNAWLAHLQSCGLDNAMKRNARAIVRRSLNF